MSPTNSAVTGTHAQQVKAITRVLTPNAVVVAFSLILGFRFFRFIAHYSVNVLYWDQWDFLASFFTRKPGLTELFFWQHGPHRQGLGLVADKFLYPLTDWNVRAETFMIGECIFVAMAVALRIKTLLFGPLQYSDVLIPAIFLTLVQHETFDGAPDPGYSSFPILLLMFYGLALQLGNYKLKYGLVLLFNILLIYTGMGVFAGLITIGFFAAQCHLSIRRIIGTPITASLTGLVIACASLASFFIHFEFIGATDCPKPPMIWEYPWFVAILFSSFGGVRSPLVLVTALGIAVLLLAAWISFVVVRRAGNPDTKSRQVALTIMVMLGFSLAFSVFASPGRVCAGLPDAAQTSRYATLLIPAFLGIYFYLLTVRGNVLRRIALVWFALFLTPGHVHIARMADRFADGKRAWTDCYRRTESIRYCDSTTHFKIYPEPEATHLKEKLNFLKEHKLNLFAD